MGYRIRPLTAAMAVAFSSTAIWQTAIAETRRLLGEVGRLDLAKLRPRHFEAYQQLVGDVCHARHGLTLS